LRHLTLLQCRTHLVEKRLRLILCQISLACGLTKRVHDFSIELLAFRRRESLVALRCFALLLRLFRLGTLFSFRRLFSLGLGTSVRTRSGLVIARRGFFRTCSGFFHARRRFTRRRVLLFAHLLAPEA